MTRSIRADNDSWSAQLGETSGPDSRTVVFFCASNGQRPYRVVEVPSDRFSAQEDLDRLTDEEILDLFRSSGSMGSPRTY